MRHLCAISCSNLELNNYWRSMKQFLDTDDNNDTLPQRFNKYIVAVGASAGGLEAIHEFFDHMPESSSFSFVVIQHLSSDYKSLLVELVAKHTHMKVFEAAHNMTIQQDCVYIIPNNKLMTVSKGRLKLADKSLVKAPNTAIDTFLHTLAEDKRERAIAIILSGTGTDGTKGIHTIKEYGGMVIVQDPGTAKFDGMPNSAIASGNIDFILPPQKMYEELFNYVNEEPVKVLQNGRIDEALLDQIFTMVQQLSGNDFNLYKTPTIIRRIGRRMMENGLKNLDDYVRFLSENEKEVRILSQDFLIGVTQFFRDKQAYELLEKTIIPDIIKNKPDGEPLKVWVCACSTGQEAYSMAILMNECLQKAGRTLEVKIFASDIDEKSIEIASRNQYELSIKKDIPPALLKKYFVQEGKFYSLISEIRKQVVFARHDVIKSPPFIKNDLVSCRNMLIYMNSVLQQKILSTFHFSLNSNGYLFLGSSETAHALKDGITEISNKWKVYQKSGPINYSSYNTYHTSGRLLARKEQGKSAEVPQSLVEKRFNKFLTADLGYVGVFIDKGYIIQEAVGNYRKFLSLPDHKIELNLLKMVPKEIAIALNTALRKAGKSKLTTHLHRLRVNKDGDEVYLNVSIQPAEEENGLTMVTFSENRSDIIPDIDNHMLSSLPGEQHNDYIYELEAELNETRSSLQLAVEEMETTNEELQSTNEELLSANEELQSSNEELQSLNEELHTLNTEHQVKIKELMELNDDLDNYFRSTDIGQVFLDANLFIRKFNPAAVSMVNMIPADIGRSIEHISNNIKAENLSGDIRSVLIKGHTIEKEILLKNGKRSLMRIMPYMRKDKHKDGVVISFVDISRVTELNNMIAGVFNASLSAILAFSAVRNHDHLIIDFRCISFNDAALDLLHSHKDDLTDALLVKQMPELASGNLFQKYVSLVEKDIPLETEFRTSAERWYHLVAVKMSDGFAATITDVTEQKLAEQKLKKNYNELIIVRETLKKLNTELEHKVLERTKELSESEERFKQVSRATNDTIWDWSLVDNTMWRSDNFTAMFGYPNDDAAGNISFWLSRVHPDDRKRVQDSVYAAINNHEKKWSAEYRVEKQNGDFAIILDRGTIMCDDLDIPYRMVGSMIDITRQVEVEQGRNELQKLIKKQQDEFYSIFKNAPALISIRRGPNLVYEFVNNAFIEFNGAQDYIGKASAHLHPDFIGNKILEIEEQVLRTGETHVAKAVQINKVNPVNDELADYWFDFIMAPVFTEEGAIDGIAFFGFEVTDLLRAQEATEELMQRKDEFMSIASHELKTPITSIQGFLQLALRVGHQMEQENKMVTYVDKAFRQLGNLTSLVNDLLDVTKIQAGKMQFNYTLFNMGELIAECVEDIQNTEEHAILIGHIDDVEVFADQHRLQQVINNFLSNAIKYSPNNLNAIVSTEIEGEELRVSVKDFGIGIPADKLEMVFDRFFRVQDATSMISGLGLGLYISSEIVERHGGSIGVQSIEGEGSEFWFQIPLRAESQDEHF